MRLGGGDRATRYLPGRILGCRVGHRPQSSAVGSLERLAPQPQPSDGVRAGHTPSPLRVKPPQNQYEKVGALDPSPVLLPLSVCKPVPGSAVQRAPFTFPAATNPLASTASIPPWGHVSGCGWELPLLGVNLSLGRGQLLAFLGSFCLASMG